MLGSSRRTQAVAYTLSLLALLAACSPDSALPTAPDLGPPVIVSRPLGDVYFGHLRAFNGYIDIQGYVPAGDDPLGPSERVELRLTTSGGDAETLSIGPGVCGRDPAWAICREYVLMLKEGADFATVASETSAQEIRLQPISDPSSRFASAYVFAEDESAALSLLTSRADLQSVGPNHLTSIGFRPLGPPTILHTAIKFNAGSAVTVGDGIVSAAAGETITLRYLGVGGVERTISGPISE